MEDVILTPIYNGTSYKYHECSNCKKEIYFEESILVPFRFEEKIKYCPFCGREVIRYGEPKFEELPNWDWMQEFESIINKAYRNLEYIIHCKKTEEERKELIEKAEFGEEYFGRSYHPLDNANVCNVVNYIARQKMHYSSKNKLKEEFENK